MTEPSNRPRLVLLAALTLAAVASIAFAIGVASNGSSTTALAAQGTTIPGYPDLGAGWQRPLGGGVAAGAEAITITAIDGSKLSLKTGDGWTRTIDATGATVTSGGQPIALSGLKVGDAITFRESRQSDGTYKVTAIAVVAPTANGAVTAIGSSSITINEPGGTSRTLGITNATTYSQGGTTVSKTAIVVGDRIVAKGTVDSSGDFTATSVTIQAAMVQGTVLSKTSTTIAVDSGGKTVTVDVTASTKYLVRGSSSATLAGIAVGDRIVAQGTLNADGSLTATIVQSGATGLPGFGAGGFGGRRGGRGRLGPGASQSAAPSILNG
jgi:hypothetical protein